MFNPNEEIQVIGFTLDDNATWEDKFKVNEILTKLNKKLELKNRYKEQIKENIKLKKQILDYQLRYLESKGE